MRTRSLAPQALSSRALSPPTLSPPTLAGPTLAGPTLAGPTLAGPTLAAVALASLAALTGCRAHIPEGRFGCGADSDCPPGQSCMAGVCRSAPPADGGMPDGGGCACDDGEFCNGAETCSGDGCVEGAIPCSPDQVCNEDFDRCDTPGMTEVRFVHASFRAGATEFQVGGAVLATLTYGEVSEPMLVPTASGQLDLRAAEIASSVPDVTRVVDAPGPMIVVLGRDDSGAADTLHAVVDDLVAGASDPTYRVLNALASTEPIAIVDQLGDTGSRLAEIPAGSGTDVLLAEAGTANATVIDAADLGTVEAVASFTGVLGDSGWIVLIGDARRRPGNPLGPTALFLGETVTALAPDPVVHVLDATDDGTAIHSCLIMGAGSGVPTPIAAGALGAGLAIPSTADLDMTIGVGRTEGEACAPAAGQAFSAATLGGDRRHLIVAWGRSDALRVTLMTDPGYDGSDHATDTELAFAHLAPTLVPGQVDLQITDGTPSVLFAAIAPGELGYTYVDRSYLQGPVAVKDLTGLSFAYTIEPADTTDGLFVLFADVGSTPGLRLVRAPYGLRWTAVVR